MYKLYTLDEVFLEERKITPHNFTGMVGCWGAKLWLKNGKIHREDGPAYLTNYNKYTEWYFEGKRHRLGGPAIEPDKYSEQWYIEGNRYTDFDDYARHARKFMTDEDYFVMILTYGGEQQHGFRK